MAKKKVAKAATPTPATQAGAGAPLVPVTAIRPRKIPRRPGRYWKVAIPTLIPGAIGAVSTVVWGVSGYALGVHLGDSTIPYGLPLLIATIPYYWRSSFFTKTNEFVGVSTLQIPSFEKEAGGFVYAPLGFMQPWRFPRGEQEDQFPGEPEMVSHMPQDEADRSRSELLEQIFITSGGPEQGPEADTYMDSPLNSELTFEPTIVVYWQVQMDDDMTDDDQGIFELVANIPGDTWPERYRALLKRMRDSVEGILREVMSQHSAAWCIKNVETLNAQALQRLTEEVQYWGIVICKVRVLGIVAPHSVSSVLQRVPEAKAKAHAQVIEATGQKKSAILIAEGDAKKTKILEKAKGKGLRLRADASTVDATHIFDMETAAEALKGANATFVLDGGIKGLAQSLAGQIGAGK